MTALGAYEPQDAEGVCNICEQTFTYVRVTKPKSVCSQFCETERLRRTAAKAKAERRALLDEIKSVPCHDCLCEFPPCAMQFDHLPGYDKAFTISQNMYCPLDVLYAELEKCAIVCACCHAIRTTKRRVIDNEPL